MGYWLLKTEPKTFSFEQLLADGKTNWNGVRNFQARNFLSKCQKGDLAFIYHSGKDKAVVGIAEVAKGAYPDPDPKKKGDWVQIDLKPVRALKTPVTLAEIKKTLALKELHLIRASRLSVMPVTSGQYQTLCQMGSMTGSVTGGVKA